jgi:hypothetical protein
VEFRQPRGTVRRGKKGRGEGESGAFIGELDVGRGLGFSAGVAMDGSRSSHAGAGLLPEEGDDPDEQALLISGWRNCTAYPFREKGKLGHGPFPGSGRIRSRGLFTFFILLFFSFLVSYLFHIFCNKASNQLKPLSKIL